MQSRIILRRSAFAAILAAAAIGAFLSRERWMPSAPAPAGSAVAADAKPPQEEAKVLKLTSDARKNLGLVVKPITLQTYWRTIDIPGVIVDRPGWSDRGVTAPAIGVVSEIHAYPGDTIRPGDRLFTLRIFSEYLQNSQAELFKATGEIELVKDQIARKEKLVQGGTEAQARVRELEYQLRRQQALITAHRQDLLTRGFSPEQVDAAAQGKFVSTITIAAPPPPVKNRKGSEEPAEPGVVDDRRNGPTYEVQELKVELGQQVQAGQLLSLLSNHHSLYIKGHAFKQDATDLERATQSGWPVRVEFVDDDATRWPTLDQDFNIRHLSNSIDPESRTFDFYLPLVNQSRSYDRDGQTFVVWRFRPGQRVRLHVPVEEFDNVIVLPAAGIVREGPEAYVFRQNGDFFSRRSVRVLHEDRLNVVLPNDGAVAPGLFVARNGAASLNRVLKAQSASGVPVGLHVHADGTVHGAH